MTIFQKACLACATAATAAITLAGAAHARTFTYDATISAVSQASTALYPLGATGTVAVTIDDSDPARALFALSDPSDPFAPLFPAPVIRVAVSVPGALSAAMPFGAYDTTATPETALTVTGAGFRYGSAYTEVTPLAPGGAPFLPLGLNSLSLTFGAPGAAPTTVAALLAAMERPGASGLFRANPEIGGGGFDFIDVRFAAPLPPVPLPASGVLLAGAALALLAVRRRVPG